MSPASFVSSVSNQGSNDLSGDDDVSGPRTCFEIMCFFIGWMSNLHHCYHDVSKIVDDDVHLLHILVDKVRSVSRFHRKD